MKTAEFIFELPCTTPDERKQIERELGQLLDQHDYNVQSSVSVPVEKALELSDTVRTYLIEGNDPTDMVAWLWSLLSNDQRREIVSEATNAEQL